MFRKCNRLLSFLLALALVITTFGSDLANAKVYAVEQEAIAEPAAEEVDEELPEIFEKLEEFPEEAPEVEDAQEAETSEDENVPEDDAEGDEETEEAIEGEESEEIEASEEAEEAVEEEVLPFADEAVIDGIKISLYAKEGVLPEGAELEIVKIESELEEKIADAIDGETSEDVSVEKTYSYDINIKVPGEDGYVQPEDGTVKVTFENILAAESDDTTLAVYHVETEGNDVANVSEVASAGADSTDVSFDAEHFSIYTVTIFKNGNSTTHVDFEAGVYKTDGTAINTGNVLRKVRIPSGESMVPSGVAPVITGYDFSYATYNDQRIAKFGIKNNKATVRIDGTSNHINIDLTVKEAVKFYYTESNNKVKSTSSHIDLGFTDDEMPSVVGAKVTINKTPYNMTDGIDESDLGVQELRLSLPQGSLGTVKTTDTIVFDVTVELPDGTNKTYTHECTTAENENAYERCINAHTYRQDKFGFDYKFNFKIDFNYGASVTYHSNFDTDKTKVVPVAWTTEEEGATETHNILAYGQTELPAYEDHTFKGWGVMENGKAVLTYVLDKDTGLFTPASVEVKDTDKIDLYAIWEENEPELINVAVYATTGVKSAEVNPQFKRILGLDYVQTDGYYPVGVIQLPSNMLKGDGPFINSQEDLDKVIAAIESIDTGSSVLGHNVGNSVGSNLKSVQLDTGFSAGKFKTALFKWDTAEYENGSIVNPDGGNFRYHLDLRFATDRILYKGTYLTGTHVDKKNAALGEGEEYLTDYTLTSADAVSYVEKYAQDYVLEGVYTDEDLTNKFTGITVTSGITLYAKFTKKDTISLGYFLLTADTTPDANSQPAKDYFPANSVKSWTGTAKDINLLKSYATVNSGEYISIYNWGGIDRNLIQYTYDEGTETKITDYVKKHYGNTNEYDFSDVVWHVYKQQKKNDFHIDGYVASYITYDANGGGTTPSDETVAYSAKDRYGLALKVDGNMFTKTDNVFVGWNTKADGTGTPYAAGEDIKLNHKYVLYAQWEKAKSYTVNFIYQKNDGSFDYANPDHSEQYTVNVPVDPSKGVEVSAVAAIPADPKADLVYTTDATTHVTTFTNKFVDAATKIGYKHQPGAEGWDKAVVRNNDDTVVINILFVRDDFDAAFTVIAPTEAVMFDGLGHKATEGTGYASDAYKDLYDVEVVANIDGIADKEITNVADSPAAGVMNNQVTDVTITNKTSGEKYVLKVENGVVTTKSPFSDKITVIDGQVKIIPRPLTITVGGVSKEYDGDYFHADKYTEAGGEITYKVYYTDEEKAEGKNIGATLDDVYVAIPKEIITSTESAKRTDEISITDEYQIIIDEKNVRTVDKVDNFDVTIINGDLVITPLEKKWKIKVTLTADAEGDGNKNRVMYNGSEQNGDLSVILSVEDESGVEYTSEELPAPKEHTGILDTFKVALTYIKSLFVLTVNAAESNVPAQSVTVNGVDYVVSGLKVSGGSGTDVGDYNIDLDYRNMKITTSEGEDVTADVSEPRTTETIGKLTIYEREVILRSVSGSKQFDGSPLTRKTVNVTGDGFANGDNGEEGAVFNVTGSQTNVGSSRNTFTYTLKENTKASNYKISTATGTLTVYGGPDNPPDEPTPPPTEPTPPPAGQVLGAVREVASGDGAAVLGARRGRTEDTANTMGRIITIIVAAGIGFMMIFIKRKKNEE